MCGLVDVGCHLWRAVEPFWHFIFWGFWIVVAIVVLGVLAKLKEIGGWPLVWGAVTSGLVGWTYWRAKSNQPLLPYPVDDDGDEDPSPHRARARPVGPKVSKRKGENYWHDDPYNPENSGWRKRGGG